MQVDENGLINNIGKRDIEKTTRVNMKGKKYSESQRSMFP